MDRRVFRPAPTTSKNHQRNALGLAAAVLLAGGLALAHLKGGFDQWWQAALLGLVGAAYFVLRLRFGRASRFPKDATGTTEMPRPERRHRFPAAPPE